MNDGGPAFPKPCDECSHSAGEHACYGMSLRQWFAGMAIFEAGTQLRRADSRGDGYRLRNGTHLTSGHDVYEAAEYVADAAYQIADAMLAERDKAPGPKPRPER